MIPPLNLNASVVVPWASLIFACGFWDMEFVYVERNAAGWCAVRGDEGTIRDGRGGMGESEGLTSGTRGICMPLTTPNWFKLPYEASPCSTSSGLT